MVFRRLIATDHCSLRKRWESICPSGENRVLNLLIIDAYDPFRRALKSALLAECPAVRLREANSGPEGLRRASEEPPHIICMDIHLPGEDGLGIATRIAALCPQASLIVITSADLPEYRQAARQAGATHFVSKGDETLADILEIVRDFVASPHAGT
jgi:DNA-binding NarL/FixJ family response regulator